MGLERVHLIFRYCLFDFFNTWGLFLRIILDLAKIHSNDSGERKKKKQTNKKYINVVGKKKSKNMVLVGEKTKGSWKTHPSAFDA